MLYTREKLLNAARLTTRLDDFGSDDFTEPLDILLSDYKASARLNLKGKITAWTYLHRLLCNRLRLHHYLKETDACREQIRQPIFILGLPRTGSTLLHELLACHPELRAPAFWEASFVPGRSGLDKFRQLLASAQILALDWLAPEFRSVHNLGRNLPHECVTLQATSFRSMQFHAAHNLQTYNRWLETCDWQPAYDCHRKYLQWLQHGSPDQRWVLKAPGHLLSLPELYATYPDAKIIQLHRDPCEVMPSMASLFLHIRKPFTRELDLHEIGRDVTRQWHRGLESSLAWRNQHPETDQMFLDIHYQELVQEPLNTAEKILSFAGMSLDEKARQLLQAHIVQHPKNKHGNHNYSLSQFGLDADELAELFSHYNSRFDLAA